MTQNNLSKTNNLKRQANDFKVLAPNHNIGKKVKNKNKEMLSVAAQSPGHHPL